MLATKELANNELLADKLASNSFLATAATC